MGLIGMAGECGVVSRERGGLVRRFLSVPLWRGGDGSAVEGWGVGVEGDREVSR